MIIDSSALIAIFFNEKYGPQLAQEMEKNKNSLRMSTLTLSECLTLIEDLQKKYSDKIKDEILSSNIRFIAPSQEEALISSKALHKYSLSFTESFVYAHAIQEDCPILTCNKSLKKTDARLVIFS